LLKRRLRLLAKPAWEGTKQWAADSALASENKIDDLVVPFLSTMDKLVEESIEKVDLDGDGD
jgi:hypothetical protein